jgi:hypothetical protein
MGATQNSQTLTAQKLVITDASGKSRAVLMGTPSGATLGFQTPTDDLGAVLTVDGSESFLFLGGAIESMKAKTPRVFLEVNKGGAGLRIAEPEGRTARLGIEHYGPSLSLLDASRQGGLSLGTDGLSLHDPGGNQVGLGIRSGVPSLHLSGSGLTPSAVLTIPESGPALWLESKESVGAWLRASQDGPSLEIGDAQGYKATIGSAGLVTPRTGETHVTSAASVTLFDKEKNVIWKAP